MIPKNRNEKKIFNFIEVNGFGMVSAKNGLRDVFVYGYFKWGRWTFIVHQSLVFPKLLSVSEASTGYLLLDKFYSIEDALRSANSLLEEKQYYLPTLIGDILVGLQRNLFYRNNCLKTLAIDTALWM